MRLLFDGQARAWEPAAREMLPMYGQALDGVTVTVFMGEEGYLAKRDGDTATLLCAGKPELFRGLAVLLAGGERLYMEQQTPFSTRGVMYDCSRNSVATVDTVKLILRRMAMMGLNVLMLYTEDTYEVPEYPSFGHYRGRYTAREMKEIDNYADLLGIEVIPCIQALSHLERALRWQAMADIKDEGTTLYVGKPQTEAFIRAMLRAASGPVRSRRIHLGLDEAHGLGLGSKLEHEGYFEKPLLMKQHLNMLKGICNEMGLRPMMWGDMLFRNHIQGNGYYQDDISLPMSAKEMVPEGYDFIYWDYYHNDRAFYDHYLSEHIKLGIKPLFAGGVCSWLGMQPNLIKSGVSIREGLAACREHGVTEVFTCIWRDDGAEGVPGAVFPGVAMFSEECWSDCEDQADRAIQRHMRALSGAEYGQVMRMGSFDELKEGLSLTGLEPPNPHKYFMWQDPLLGLFDAEASTADIAAHYRRVREGLVGMDSVSPEMADAFSLTKALAGYLETKAGLGVRIKAAYDAGDKAGLLAIASLIEEQTLPSLNGLYALHSGLWMKYYKPFGWEVQDVRYGGMMLRLKAAVKRLRSYIEGTLGSIPELEEERLTIGGFRPDGTQDMVSFNSYLQSVSVSGM